MEIRGYKKGSKLFFERGDKSIVFDLIDNKFYRTLKNGSFKETTSGQAFFRKAYINDIADNFQEEAYGKLIRKVAAAETGYRNFASIFYRLAKYSHLESYLLLGINFGACNVFKRPVSDFPKDVIAFMKESRHMFNNPNWETNYSNQPELFTNICRYVRRNHYMDLEVYRIVVSMLESSPYYGSFTHFVHCASPFGKEVKSGRWDTVIGMGCEYKTLLSYLIRVHRTEAYNFNSALTSYKDYLQMSRKIEIYKMQAKMEKSSGTMIPIEMFNNVGYSGIEKYPKYLRTRHDIVAKNYRDYSDRVDEAKFSKLVNPNYAYSWGKYMMVTPKSSADIKAEGASLHHCVASYVSMVMDGTTQIMFMRETEDESFITVEVRGKAIVQARGYNNRSLTTEEKRWLTTYARAKNLTYGDVKHNPKMPSPPVTALQKYSADEAFLRELSIMLNT